MSFVPVAPANNALRHTATRSTTGSNAWQLFSQIPDVANGDPTTYSPIFVSPGLDEEYHWLPDAAFGLIPAITTEATLRARIVFEAAYHSSALSTAIPADATRRTVALILAIARAAIRRAWITGTADIITAQTAIVPAAATPDAAGTLQADVSAKVTAAVHATEAQNIATIYDAAAATWVPNVFRAAIAAPVCAGVTIVFTGTHHFQDPHKVVQQAVAKQVFGATWTTVAGLTQEVYEDVLWHKAAHPISSGYLVWMARNPVTKAKVVAVGIASAGVRVPALFAPERAASAIATLVRNTAQAAISSNVTIATAVVTDLDASVAAALTQNPTIATVAAGTEAVENWLKSHGVDVSWCAGYMSGLEADAPPALRNMTVLRSKAITRIVAAHPWASGAGKTHYELAQKWARTQARDGNLAGIGLFGSPQPPTRVPAAAAPP